MHISSTCNNELEDLTLMKMMIARFVGTGGFLIRCSDSHTKINTSPFKEVRLSLLANVIPLF